MRSSSAKFWLVNEHSSSGSLIDQMRSSDTCMVIKEQPLSCAHGVPTSHWSLGFGLRCLKITIVLNNMYCSSSAVMLFCHLGIMWIRMCPPQRALYPSTVGPAGSIRSFSELHPRGKIPFPVSKIPSTCTFSQTGWNFLNTVSTDFCLFLVSFVITPYSNHWSDLCWDYTLPRPPQKHTSAQVEVSIWFL